MSVLGIGIGAIIDSIANPAGAGGRALTADDLVGPLQDIRDVLHAIVDVFQNADHQASAAVDQAKAARVDIRHLGNDVKLITEHTYDTVIPHSMSWLEGDINRRLLTKFRFRLASLKRQIDFLMGWRGQIIHWRNTFVDPVLHRYIAFEKYYNKGPRNWVTVLGGWLSNPQNFAVYIMSAISRYISVWYQSPKVQDDLDALVTVLVDASPDRYRHVVHAVDQILDSPWP